LINNQLDRILIYNYLMINFSDAIDSNRFNKIIEITCIYNKKIYNLIKNYTFQELSSLSSVYCALANNSCRESYVPCQSKWDVDNFRTC
jgi:hypothetical protein